MRISHTGVEVCDLDLVTVTNVSQTLVQLGVVINPDVKNLSFLNAGNFDIRVAVGRPATAADYILLVTAATALRVTTSAARRLQFFCANAAGSVMDVQQMGDE